MKDFIILSDGTKFPNDNLLKKNQNKLKKKQRELSRKKNRSKNYKKQNIKLAKLHNKIQNQRQYINHLQRIEAVNRFKNSLGIVYNQIV